MAQGKLTELQLAESRGHVLLISQQQGQRGQKMTKSLQIIKNYEMLIMMCFTDEQEKEQQFFSVYLLSDCLQI